MTRGKPEDNSPRGNEIRENIARQQRINRSNLRGHADAADWREADNGKLSNAISAVTRHGFAIRFGYTRDMGAFAIGIIGDGEPVTHFIRPTEDIDLFLSECIAAYSDPIDSDK